MEDDNKPTQEALRGCLNWLSECLKIGWQKSQLDALERIWWAWHDRTGKLLDTEKESK